LIALPVRNHAPSSTAMKLAKPMLNAGKAIHT
jgi:hypothetical protein